MNRDEMIKELAKTPPPYAYNQKEFIPGKTPVYYSGPFWDHEEVEMALKTFLDGKWLVTGEKVYLFQNLFSKKYGVKYSHMVNSGSSANLVLITALKKHLGWEDGDEIIVSPVGFPTTIAPIAQNNLKPVFIDIEFYTLNFNLHQIVSKITPRTKAIFVSPVLGNPPDMEFLKALCEEHNILLIGDNCDSLGSRFNSKLITDYYYAWTTSFYPAHHLTTGEGGMVCCNDPELAKTIRSISWWGRACHCVGQMNLLSCGTCGNRFSKWLEDEGVDEVVDHKYVFSNMGYNLKPLDLQGAIGIAQLRKADTIDSKRRENYKALKVIFETRDEIEVVGNGPGADPCWFGVPILCKTPEIKRSLVQHLEDNKIQTRNYFAGNILLHPGYKHLDNAKDYPNANMALSHVFFVGCPPHYGPEVLSYFEEVLKKWESTKTP